MLQDEATQNGLNQANGSGRPKGGRPVLPSLFYSPSNYFTPAPELVWPLSKTTQLQEPIKGLMEPE